MEVRNVRFDIEKVTSNNESILDELYDNNALTIEGLAIESVGDFVEYLKRYFKDDLKEVTVYEVSGNIMNTKYCLTRDNRYPDDLTIVSIKLDNFKNIENLAIERFSIGARWFNDIVDNNARREHDKVCR